MATAQEQSRERLKGFRLSKEARERLELKSFLTGETQTEIVQRLILDHLPAGNRDQLRTR